MLAAIRLAEKCRWGAGVILALGIAGCGSAATGPPASHASSHAVASAIPAGAFWHPRAFGRWTPPAPAVAPARPSSSTSATPAAPVRAPTQPVPRAVASVTKPAPTPVPTGQLAMRDVKVADPVENSFPLNVTGFAVQINPSTASATIGPSWIMSQTGEKTTFTENYAGETVTLPTEISITPPWPEIYAVNANTNDPSIEVGTTSTSPAVCNHGGGGAVCLSLAAVEEAGGISNGPSWSYSSPTWVVFDYAIPHVTWSGGSFDVGTPSFAP